jgi:L-histidine N-alpha-methyltransferase
VTSLDQEGRFSLIAGSAPDLLREFEDDVREGLTSDPKRLSCRFLYDAQGSALFEEICAQPEYYLTRVEESILRRIASELAERFAAPPQLVELGSGNAEKTRHLIEALIARHEALVYRPIDISRESLEESSRTLLDAYPRLQVHAVAAEYLAGLQLLSGDRGPREAPRLVCWLGSSIGNFHRRDAAAFLATLRAELGPQDVLLLGVDLRKDRKVLEAAYDDAAGVTARFIKNLIVRIDRELGGDLDARRFAYRVHYDEVAGRVEMALEGLELTHNRIEALELEFDLALGERIYVENSYKYSSEEIREMAGNAGFNILGQWRDPAGWFCEVLLGS